MFVVSREGRSVISRDGDDSSAAKVCGGRGPEYQRGPPPNRWGSAGGVCQARMDRGTAKVAGEVKTGKTGEAGLPGRPMFENGR